MIRAVIVDDEILALNRLEKLLNESGLATVSGKFSEPETALGFLDGNNADAVFIDIEMPDIDGIELANRIIDKKADIPVVFVTAYNQYAVEAFRLNAIDYLLKPVSPERLCLTLSRIKKDEKISLRDGKISVSCFGGFKVSCGGNAAKFRTEKARELFALLVDRAGACVSRSKILDCLWEDFDGDRALIHFNTTLYNVKSALLACGYAPPIRYENGCYFLTTDRIDCDYFGFCGASENGADIERAAELYVGEYLAGLDCDWASAKRAALEERYIGLLLEIADRRNRAGDHKSAARWLETGLLYVPLHRDLNFAIVRTHLLSHNRATAAKYFEIYRDGLMKKFRMSPDPEFCKLMK